MKRVATEPTQPVVKRAKKAKTAKAKTAVDKRQDRAISKIYRSLIETKRYDISDLGNGSAYDVDNTVTLLAPGAGTTDLQMVGSKISPTFLDLRFIVSPGSATARTLLRVTLIRSKARFIPSTAVNTSTQGLYQYGGAAGGVSGSFAWDNRRHYTVLYDELIPVGTSNAGMNIYTVRHLQKRLTGVTEFDAAGGTSAERGQYYICCTSDQTNASGADPQWSVAGSIYYKDA